MAGQAFFGCAGVLTFLVAVSASRIGMSTDQRVEAVVKIVVKEKDRFGFDPVTGRRFRIGSGDDLRRGRRRSQRRQFVQQGRDAGRQARFLNYLRQNHFSSF